MRQPTNISTLASITKQGIEARLLDLHTAMPGIIVSFNSATQLCAVQPAIRRIMKVDDGEQEILTPVDIPQLINVPVNFPSGGGYSLTFPVSAGDEVLIVFCERAIDDWYINGGVQTPTTRRLHSLSDAVVIPGIKSRGNAIGSFNSSEAELRDESGSVKISLGSTITITGDTEITGALTNNGVNVGSTHIHTQANDTGGDVQQPTSVPR